MKKIVGILLLLFTLSGCTTLDFPSSSGLENNSFTPTDNKLVAHFIDVGQGDASFIELPNKKTMIIDAGESYESDVVISYIEELGYDYIDYVIATHPHTDHIGGLRDVLDTFDVDSIYMPKAISTSKTYENLLNTIDKHGYKVKTGKKGVEIVNEDDLKIDIVAPCQDSYSNLNNYSIVLKITYGEVSFLYTGDAEITSLKEITDDISADVLKVGHHGSNTSTSKEFLDLVKPSYAIISVGKNNRYDHPNSSTIKLLEEYTDKIYRTDISGNIVVTSDGQNIEVEVEK